MIDSAALGFALAAGLVAALNPCGFAFLPAYLGMVTAGASSEPSTTRAVGRALTVTAAMSGGFLTVFGVFGLIVAPLVVTAQRYLPFATVIIGVILIVLGIWLLAGKELTIMVPRLGGGSDAPTTQLRSAYGYGLSYALASLSCTAAPFLAVIGTTFDRGSILNGVLAFVAYAAGMTITVGIAAILVALAGSAAATGLRRVLPYVGRIAGALVFLTGLYVTYYGYYEIRLFFFGASAQDPVIEAAGAVQNWLAAQVGALGVWPLVGVLMLGAASAAAWQLAGRRRHASRRDSTEEAWVAEERT
ncbi:cytochrome c biogenesis CcdA family protein [Mycolicibacterium austroafricanum]|uniref:Cytochrome c biogenesis CcdA family protein n=1 Tax=Mycolicibacterium austroafricanum TaxID=39687 RepID=A0ABT8H9L3_MYCAO|nr:cytochrome c biogenesis CcdA family protein [Mycolicibacterium austroafricanum]MDN4517447.1 cytochrome c biogenesis CcdA family protein [Mycolicibacterium austroafricanum]PQP41016.1 hypothetical protein C6A88_29335 [Mycolicibacterium austroafricanum]QRZ07585.1 cytochrome c biogenesis protein CcdA [Mycolicibacterium austroafricanum]QZT69248.1 cytochrome c biogenesis CcdA family protein [Mycolicibacterium austroafricanum]